MVKLWCFGVWALVCDTHTIYKRDLEVGSFGCIKETIPFVSYTTLLVTELEQQLMCSLDLI